jgi:hypothetical protein
MHELGSKSVKETDVLFETGYARTDSKGYRVPLKKLTKELGYVNKKDGGLELTDDGLRVMESKHGSKKPITNEENHEKLKAKLSAVAKAPERAVHAFWDLLIDGGLHTVQELLTATEYKRTDSAGFKNIMKACKQFDLCKKENGAYSFTDKVFPFGRPE